MKFLVIFLVLFGANHSFSDDKILIIGDSLTEGYGVDKKYSYPSVLQDLLDKNNLKYKVINGGVSGSTTASGKSRLKWFLKSKPKILILALGANDGLRGFKVGESKKNLQETIKLAKEHNLIIFLAKMQMPPNYGKEYLAEFSDMFNEIISEMKVKEIPFILEGVAGNKALNIEDGIHPNRAGYKIIGTNLFNVLKEHL